MRLAWIFAVLSILALGPATAQFRAPDFTGVWKLESSDSKTPIIVEFKQEGQKLSGKLKTAHGEFPLQNGSVEGQDLFFNVVIERDEYKLKTTYRGHQFAEEIQFTIEAGERTLLAIGRKEQPKEQPKAKD
jgi:hypothetical protein